MAIPIKMFLWPLVTHFGFFPSGLDSGPLSPFVPSLCSLKDSLQKTKKKKNKA
jgi:hypothetical protein